MERIWSEARLAGLAIVLWATASQASSTVRGSAIVVPLFLSTAAAGWLGWMACRRFGASAQWTWIPLAVLAGSGGALIPYAPIATAFLAVAAIGAGIAFEPIPASVVGAMGFAAAALAVPSAGAKDAVGLVTQAALAAVAATVAGHSRREYQDRALQAEQLLAARTQADEERDLAAALAERNRIGREVHDLLAHSLGALSVQLDAADALLEHGEGAARVRPLLQQARRLAVQGLEETREAVHALRDEPVALAEQLAAIAARDGAELSVTGEPRSLDPTAGLALYRVTQEALTNARKHAPGARVCIQLRFEPSATVLVIANDACTGDPAERELSNTGGGFGLQGMRERIELVGGQVAAEPAGAGWEVRAEVPG